MRRQEPQSGRVFYAKGVGARPNRLSGCSTSLRQGLLSSCQAESHN